MIGKWEMGNIWVRMGSAYHVLNRQEERKKNLYLAFHHYILCDIRLQTQPRCLVCQRRHSQYFPIVHPIPPHLTQSHPISVPHNPTLPTLPTLETLGDSSKMGMTGMGLEWGNRVGKHLGKTGKFRTARKRKVKKLVSAITLHISFCGQRFTNATAFRFKSQLPNPIPNLLPNPI